MLPSFSPSSLLPPSFSFLLYTYPSFFPPSFPRPPSILLSALLSFLGAPPLRAIQGVWGVLWTPSGSEQSPAAKRFRLYSEVKIAFSDVWWQRHWGWGGLQTTNFNYTSQPDFLGSRHPGHSLQWLRHCCRTNSHTLPSKIASKSDEWFSSYRQCSDQTRLPFNRRRIIRKQDTQTRGVLLLWPWLWPYDLDTRTWPRLCKPVPA